MSTRPRGALLVPRVQGPQSCLARSARVVSKSSSNSSSNMSLIAAGQRMPHMVRPSTPAGQEAPAIRRSCRLPMAKCNAYAGHSQREAHGGRVRGRRPPRASVCSRQPRNSCQRRLATCICAQQPALGVGSSTAVRRLSSTKHDPQQHAIGMLIKTLLTMVNLATPRSIDPVGERGQPPLPCTSLPHSNPPHAMRYAPASNAFLRRAAPSPKHPAAWAPTSCAAAR
jgi:hypothetical protein